MCNFFYLSLFQTFWDSKIKPKIRHLGIWTLFMQWQPYKPLLKWLFVNDYLAAFLLRLETYDNIFSSLHKIPEILAFLVCVSLLKNKMQNNLWKIFNFLTFPDYDSLSTRTDLEIYIRKPLKSVHSLKSVHFHKVY